MPIVRESYPKVDDQHVDGEKSSATQQIATWEVPYLLPGCFRSQKLNRAEHATYGVDSQPAVMGPTLSERLRIKATVVLQSKMAPNPAKV